MSLQAFGFMSCERSVGATEGLNVLVEETLTRVGSNGQNETSYRYGVSNIEYTGKAFWYSIASHLLEYLS